MERRHGRRRRQRADLGRGRRHRRRVTWARLMGLNITGRVVRGAYQGRSARGQPEAFPGTDRLLAALVAAAGSGPHAESDGRDLKISERHRAELRWLEERAP